MKDKIITYILTDIINSSDYQLNSSDDLLTSGLVDSMGIMKLITFLEGETDTKIPPEDMVIENFISVDAITDYLNL